MSWSDERERHEGYVSAVFADGSSGGGWGPGGVTVTRAPDGRSLEYDEWEGRPPSAIVGWRVECDCLPAHITEADLQRDRGFWGKKEHWQGPLWHRVTEQAGEDLAQRRIHAALDDDDAAWIDEARPDVTELMREAWREHVTGDAGMVALREAWQRSRAAADDLDEAVAAARATGSSWAEIGGAVSMSRQSAHERWRHLDEQRRGTA